MPGVYGDIEGGYQVAWLNTPFEGVISSDDLYDMDSAWEEMLFEGDEYTVEGDVTFYCLAERPTGYYAPNEELSCCMADQADWTGTWAFDGYDWSASDDTTVVDYLLNADLGADGLDIDNEDEYIEYGYFGDGYLIGAKDNQLFEIEMTGVDHDGFGIYTIKASNGKYVAITADGELTLTTDASSAYATWNIWFDGDTYCNIVWNRAVDFVLLFNQETGSFGAVSADDAELNEPCNLYMYGLSAIDYEYFIAK